MDSELKKAFQTMKRVFQTPELNEAFKRFGAQGGKTRAKRLSPQGRKAIAKKAAAARWRKRKA